MKLGFFSDTGYRFRKNAFNRKEDWYPFGSSVMERFFDIPYFNSDTFDVGEDNNVIAEMYFRLEIDQVTHTKIVKQLMD